MSLQIVFWFFLLQVVLIYLSLYTHPCVLTVTHLIPKCLNLRPLPVMDGLLRAISIRESSMPLQSIVNYSGKKDKASHTHIHTPHQHMLKGGMTLGRLKWRPWTWLAKFSTTCLISLLSMKSTQQGPSFPDFLVPCMKNTGSYVSHHSIQ